MMIWTGPLLPLAALVWPLLLAALTALPGLRRQAVRLLPFAPLPALWLAVAGVEGVTTAPGLLLGVTLGLDAARRLLMGMTAALWLIAGLAAQPMAGKPHTAVFSGFWCLTLAGNIGVFLALDVVTFYVAFAAVSLAAWFLVVHDRTEVALRAGRIYIVIALAGEVSLLVGLLLGAAAAGGVDIEGVRVALGASGAGPVAVALLVTGFGIKVGLVPLHVWLPLAHPAAPVPASAVLSGAIVKAGLFGLILFLPDREFGSVLMAFGLTGTFGAALWGLTQSNPKAVLAYSTVSQMGLMVMLVGAGGAPREMVPFLALHHGFAKGALFLLVGAMLAASDRRHRMLCPAFAAAVSASVAGLPFTGGALAKAAVKPGLTDAATLALSLSSVATTIILVWFLSRLWLLPNAGKNRDALAASPLSTGRCRRLGLCRSLAILAKLDGPQSGLRARDETRPRRAAHRWPSRCRRRWLFFAGACPNARRATCCSSFKACGLSRSRCLICPPVGRAGAGYSMLSHWRLPGPNAACSVGR